MKDNGQLIEFGEYNDDGGISIEDLLEWLTAWGHHKDTSPK